MQIQNNFSVMPSQSQQRVNPLDEINLTRIEADLSQAQVHQAYMWQQFAAKVRERDAAVASGLPTYRVQAELNAVEETMNAAAELSNRLGALYHVYKLGGLAALGRVTLGWADKDAQEEAVIRTSVTLG